MYHSEHSLAPFFWFTVYYSTLAQIDIVQSMLLKLPLKSTKTILQPIELSRSSQTPSTLFYSPLCIMVRNLLDPLFKFDFVWRFKTFALITSSFFPENKRKWLTLQMNKTFLCNMHMDPEKNSRNYPKRRSASPVISLCLKLYRAGVFSKMPSITHPSSWLKITAIK